MPDERFTVQAPAIYARVSSEDQVSGTSLEDQVDKCLKQAAVYGWEIPPERIFIDDGYSGATLNRPAITRLRAAVRDGQVDCVMVFKLDRLSRNIRDTVNLVLEEWSKEYQVVFRSVTEDFNTNSPLGTLIFSILASFAHFERDVIRDRTESGRRRRFIQGRRAVGEPPFGYNRGEVNGTMTVDPKQAAVVQRIFRLYLSGHGFMRIATMLNEAGYRTSRGNLWTDKATRDIVINAVYTGQVKYSGEYGPGQHEPLIDADTFAAAQALRQSREKVGGRALGTPFLLAGLLRCRGCNQLMYTQPATESKRRRKDGSVYITYNQPYYQCGGRLKKGAAFCSCGYIQQDVLEEHVVARLKERFGAQVAEEQTIRSLRRELNAQMDELARDLQQIEATMQEKRRAMARWERAFEQGDLSAARFSGRVERLEQEIAALEGAQAEAAERLEGARRKQINVDWLRRVGAQVDTWEVLPMSSRKQLLHYLIDQIRVWKPGQGSGNHKEQAAIECDIVWNRLEQALPEGDEEFSPAQAAGGAM